MGLVAHPDEVADTRVFVDGDLLPPYMGVSVKRKDPDLMDLFRTFYPRDTIFEPDTFEAWLTKLVHRRGIGEYHPVCRLWGVDIIVEIADQTIIFKA